MVFRVLVSVKPRIKAYFVADMYFFHLYLVSCDVEPIATYIPLFLSKRMFDVHYIYYMFHV